MSKLTTHMPFHAATSVEIPMKNPMKGRTRQARVTEDKVMSIIAIKLMTIVTTPKPRAKMTRGRFPLHIVHLMKLGCAC